MVLGRQYQAFHSCLPGRAGNLACVELHRVEDGGAFITVSPLFIRERVYREMNETVELHFVPRQLPRMRDWSSDFGGIDVRGCRGSRYGAEQAGYKERPGVSHRIHTSELREDATGRKLLPCSET